jgi:hypothetical protein
VFVHHLGDISRREALSRTVVLATLAFAGLPYGGVNLVAWQTKSEKKAEEGILKDLSHHFGGVWFSGSSQHTFSKIYQGENCVMGRSAGSVSC